jgi:hypothetical protein
MILDNWLSGESISEQMVNKALDELQKEADTILDFVQRGKYWDGYVRLMASISFLNVAAQQHQAKLPHIIRRLLNWIQQIKSTIDKIVKGIGGNGYSIGVSAPFGVSVSVSFPV